MKLVNTPYDDVFRTLINDCSEMIIPLVNETFEEHFTGKEEVILHQNEHFLNQQDGGQEEKITDSNIEIVGTDGRTNIHYECQSWPDHTMLIRMFEYDSQIALRNSSLEADEMKVFFPRSAVLYLRSNKGTPDRFRVVIEVPKPGRNGEYEIPIVKAKTYSIDEIFDRKLLFLIPFYIFSHEGRFEEYNKNEEKLAVLKEEYGDIRNRLEALVEAGEIDEYRKCMLIDLTNKVLEHIASDYEKIREGVKPVMGGKVLEYEAKTIRNDGINEGWKAGIREGRREGVKVGRLEQLLDLVKLNLLSVKDAAEQAQLSEEDFLRKLNNYRA